MRAVLLGATRGMGRAVARELAGRGARLCLLGRDLAELARSARDLEARGAPAPVGTVHCDLMDPEEFGSALDRALALTEGADAIFVTAGVFASQEELESNAVLRRQMLAVNFVNTIEFCEQARPRLLARGGGALCVFSSVAGERGRRPAVLYGAAKAGLSRYLEGLDHRYRRDGLRVLCVKPGFVRTGMTQHLKAPPFAGSPDRVARQVVRAFQRDRAELYTPRVWRWIMLVVRLLPRGVMRRAAF